MRKIKTKNECNIVTDGSIVYYISTLHSHTFVQLYNMSIANLCQMSDIVIDMDKNSIIKLRWNIQDVVEAYLDEQNTSKPKFTGTDVCISDFLQVQKLKADTLAYAAGIDGQYHDGGASEIRRECTMYEAGMNRTVPKIWELLVKQMADLNDPEYQKYLELKKKFEPC